MAIFKISAAARPQFVEDVEKWALAVGGKAEIAPFKRLAVGWASRLVGERERVLWWLCSLGVPPA